MLHAAWEVTRIRLFHQQETFPADICPKEVTLGFTGKTNEL